MLLLHIYQSSVKADINETVEFCILRANSMEQLLYVTINLLAKHVHFSIENSSISSAHHGLRGSTSTVLTATAWR